MKKVLKSFLVVLIASILVITGTIPSQFCEAENLNTRTTNENFEKISKSTVVAENNNISFSIDPKGHFEIINNKTKYVWSSYPKGILDNTKTIGINRQNFQSEIVVNYVYKDVYGNTSSYEETSVSGTEAIDNDAVTVYKIENGAKVVYDFYSICASIAVEYKMKDNGLSVSIRGEEVLEGQEFKDKVKDIATQDQLDMIQESYITSICILPAFGAGDSSAKGFVFVPDGCGAYMDYKELAHVTENVSIPVFGQEETIDVYKVWELPNEHKNRPIKAYFPMFAISQNDNGMIGIIADGYASSSLNTYKSSKANAYTGVNTQVNYRTVSYAVVGGRKVQNVSKIKDQLFDFSVNYYFFNNSLTYADIAKYYRDKLISNGKLTLKDNKLGLSLNIIGAIDVQSHVLGIPCRKIVALTTYKEANEILNTYMENSVKNIHANYIGWNNNGVQNKKITNSAKALFKLGGNKELKKLLSNAKDSGVSLYLDADLQTLQKSGRGISVLNDVAKTVFDKPAIIRNFSFSNFEFEKTGLRFISLNGFEKSFKKYIRSANKLGDNVGLSFNSISSRLYSDFGETTPTTRVDYLDVYIKGIETVKHNISANAAYSYMWEFVDRIYEAPSSSSRQLIYDGEIPMYQMILHGVLPMSSPSINNSANKRDVFLRAIETGVEPCFTVMHENSEIVNGTDFDYFYGTTYSSVLEDSVAYYNECDDLLELISNSTITNYRILSNGVSQVSYSNGVNVFVNYNDNPYTTNGVTVPANGFIYRR